MNNTPIKRSTIGDGTERSESTTHSFVVKIWLEETAEETGRAIWRGHITHVSNGERRYLKRLDDIITFIAPYLESMKVKLGPWWQVRQWVLKRWGAA